MNYLPTRTGIPVVDRNLRDIADAMTTLGSGSGSTVSIGGSSVIVPAGSAVINWGIETGVDGSGVTVTFTTAFSSTNYVPAWTAYVGSEDVQITVVKLSATQMSLTPIGRTGVTISWSAIGS